MNTTCVVVAGAETARFFRVEAVDSPRVATRLVESAVLANPPLRLRGRSVTGRVRTETNTNRQGGPVHPIAAQRERHRTELGRRFGDQIARHAAALTKSWKEGTIVLVAERRALGVLRKSVRGKLGSGIKLDEVAKDLVKLTPAELHDHLSDSLKRIFQ